MKLETIFENITRLCFDTAPIIYFVEANPQYDAVITEIFQFIVDKRLVGITSVITLTEVLVHPIRVNATHLQTQYRNLLMNSENFELAPIDSNTATIAASLRARHNIRTPDALQIAAALSAGCQAFLTNDHALRRVTDLRVIVLDDLQ